MASVTCSSAPRGDDEPGEIYLYANGQDAQLDEPDLHLGT